MSVPAATRRFAALVLLSGCASGTTTPTPPPPPPPPPPPTISLAPQRLDLVVGETGQFNATITNGTGTINWSTSAGSVATVSQSGLVTAVSAGNATITASLAGQTNVSATAPVEVTEPEVSIDLVEITQNGAAVNLNDIQGTVTGSLDLVLPSSFDGAVEVRFGTAVLGRVEIVDGEPQPSPGALLVQRREESAAGAGSPAVAAGGQALGALATKAKMTQVDVLTPSHAVEVLTGDEIQALAPNNPVEMLAQLVNAQNQVVKTFTGPTVTPNNRTTPVLIRGTLLGNTSMRNGRTYGTELEVVIGSADYGDGPITRIDAAQIERVEVLSGAAGTAVFGADAVSGVVNYILKKDVMPASGGLAGIGEGRFAFTQMQITAGGNTYSTNLLNYDPVIGGALLEALWDIDQRAPLIPALGVTFRSGAGTLWANESTSFVDLLAENGVTWTGSNPFVTDEGVGGVSCHLRYSTNGTSFFTTPITTAADLGFETSTPSLRFRLYCNDDLANESFRTVTNGTNTVPQLVGLDFTKPNFAFQLSRNGTPGLFDLATNPAAGTAAYFTATDPTPAGGSSGIRPFQPFQIRLERGLDGLLGLGRCIVGDFLNDACQGVPYDQDSYVPSFGDIGEYTFDAGAWDAANNFSGSLSLRYTYNPNQPVISNLSTIGQLFAGQPASFDWRVDDELEVMGSAFGIKYNGVTNVPVFEYQYHGTPFDGQFTRSASRSVNRPFSASLERLTLSASQFWVPDGVERRATHLLRGGVNTAGVSGYHSEDISASVNAAFTSFRVGATGLDRVEFIQNAITICRNPFGAQGDCQGVPEMALAGVDAYYPAGGVSRIQDMFLAKVAPVNGSTASLLRDTPMTHTRQNFGSFFVDQYRQTVHGMQYHPGDYQLQFYGQDQVGNLLEGRTIPLTVKLAVRFDF